MENKYKKISNITLSTEYQVRLKDLIRYEFTSFIGRLFYNKPPQKNTIKNLLNLGCGPIRFDSWVNADLYSGIKPWKKYPHRPDWMIDLRYPLNCDSNFWDGIFAEHVLEHLYPDQVKNLLTELHRTMKPGAWIRITVPDLKKYVDYYNGNNVNKEFTDRWQTGCEAIRALTQNWLHFSLWDTELMCLFLEDAGFVNVKEVSFMKGTEPILLKDHPERQWETLYIEAKKREE